MQNPFTFIDLFAGIGGFRIALESFGGKCVYTSEWDKQAQITYSANFGDIPDGDITKIKSNKIPAHNIICAGFPCQAFSISGKRQGFEDTRGTLFFDVARIAKYHKPEVLFLENVRNFATHDNGRTLAVILKTLSKIGYTTHYKVLNASLYGAPQSRERVYMVAFRNDLGVRDFQFPQPTYKPVKLADVLEPDEKTVAQIINRKDIVIHNDPKKLRKSLFNTPLLQPIRVGTINKGGQGERIYSPEGHAITFSAYGGGAGGKTGAYLINGKVRRLSPRECARAMGYPDTYKIPVSTGQAYKQFGNSVVVPVLKAVFGEIMKALEKKPIKKKVEERVEVTA